MRRHIAAGAIPIPEVTGSVTDILSSATESLGLGSSTSVTGGSGKAAWFSYKELQLINNGLVFSVYSGRWNNYQWLDCS